MQFVKGLFYEYRSTRANTDFFVQGNNYLCAGKCPGGVTFIDEKGSKHPWSLKVAEEEFNLVGFRQDSKNSDCKPTNPKDAVGIKKAPMSTIPANVLMELSLALMEGARKYGRHNYRKVGVRSSVYYDAAMRHLMDWWEGVDTDKDSGLSHLTKAMACLVVLRDSMLRKNLNDDRPPASPKGWLEDLNKKAEALLVKYPNPEAAITRG